MPAPADEVEVVCAHCHRRFEVIDPSGRAAVPTDPFLCAYCGAVLEAVVVRVVHHVATTVKKAPAGAGFDEDDVTPVQTSIPLAVRRTGGPAED